MQGLEATRTIAVRVAIQVTPGVRKVSAKRSTAVHQVSRSDKLRGAVTRGSEECLRRPCQWFPTAKSMSRSLGQDSRQEGQ
jgi:hypothetical protein